MNKIYGPIILEGSIQPGQFDPLFIIAQPDGLDVTDLDEWLRNWFIDFNVSELRTLDGFVYILLAWLLCEAAEMRAIMDSIYKGECGDEREEESPYYESVEMKYLVRILSNITSWNISLENLIDDIEALAERLIPRYDNINEKIASVVAETISKGESLDSVREKCERLCEIRKVIEAKIFFLGAIQVDLCDGADFALEALARLTSADRRRIFDLMGTGEWLYEN